MRTRPVWGIQQFKDWTIQFTEDNEMCHNHSHCKCSCGEDFSLMTNIWTDKGSRCEIDLVKAELQISANFSLTCQTSLSSALKNITQYSGSLIVIIIILSACTGLYVFKALYKFAFPSYLCVVLQLMCKASTETVHSFQSDRASFIYHFWMRRKCEERGFRWELPVPSAVYQLSFSKSRSIWS